MRVVRRWRRLPRAAVGAPSLAGLKARLNGAGGNLGWWKVALPMAGGGTGWALRPPLIQTMPCFYDQREGP